MGEGRYCFGLLDFPRSRAVKRELIGKNARAIRMIAAVRLMTRIGIMSLG